jgi:hypothetical protein
MFGQGAFLSDLYLLKFITGREFESPRSAVFYVLRMRDALSKPRRHRKVERLMQNGNSSKEDAYGPKADEES